MLREWGEQRRGQEFKCAVSQTIYASLHVGFEGALTPDADTNGFPKVRRDELIRLLRRSGVFILGGDQHLATFSQVGVESPDDGVYQFSVPALGNIFWRWFYPSVEGKNRKAGDPSWLGEFTDGLGNPFRMLAVANPERQSLLGQKLRQRYLIPKEEAASGLGDELRASQGDGYGIARFHKDTRKITVECWPYNADPERGGKQFAGWPATIDAPLP
jgi:alkaline phosphatase D